MPISKKEVTKILRLAEIEPSFAKAKNKEEIKELVGNFVVEQINLYLDGSNSPVSGGSFKKFKKDKSASQLFEEGDLRANIISESVQGGIKVGVFNPDEAPKAFNHNVGDTLPQRKFIPFEDENFKKPIIDGIKRIIKEQVAS